MTIAEPIRVLVAEDHAVVRSGIVGIINAQPDMRVVAEAPDGQSAIERIRFTQPDVALVDLQMPIVDGVGVVNAICSAGVAAKLVILTTYDTDDDIERALTAGAKAYLLKDVTPLDLVQCIRAVHAGRTWIAPTVAAKLADRLQRVQLTIRELEVLKLISKGRSTRRSGGN